MSCGRNRATIKVKCKCGIVRQFCDECWSDWEGGPLSEELKCDMCQEKIRKG